MATAQGKRPAQDQNDEISPGKRIKSEELTFSKLLEECGCRIAAEDDVPEYLVDDPRKLRRNLEQRLTLNDSLRRNFLDGIREHLEPPEVLHAALKPMTVTGNTAYFTGDSLVRALLNIPPLQRDLSEYLLQRIPEFSSDDDNGGFGQRATGTQAQLILGQFRWLDCLSDPHAVTSMVLEVLPAMPPEAQRDAITFLPEVAPEDDHPAVLEALESLVSDSSEFLITAIEAASNLALSDEDQQRVTDMVASRLESVDVDDLPAVVRHLLQCAATSDTIPKLKKALHFVTISDPRMEVPDRKGKGKMPVPGEDPESRTLAAMKQALQFGKGAADAALKSVRSISAPEEHKTFDLWLMIALASIGPDRRRSVHSMLKKKFADGHAGPSWLERSVSGHAMALEKQFSSLLALAQHLLSDASAAVSAAGAALFASLFTEFADAYCRQEVLRALHTHLGATSPAEATAALGVLQRLAHERTTDLMQYAAFLTNILDYVAQYNAEQLTASFDVFAELVVGACRAAAAPGGSTQGAGAAAGGRSRMEDELFIFLRKQLSGAFPAHRRVGAVGVVALVQRLGKEMEEEGGGDDTLLAQRYRESRALLDSTLTAAASCPDTLAFLCDALAAETERGTLTRSLMEYLCNTLTDNLESQFVKESQQWSVTAGQEAWWNLNGGEGDVVVTLLPPKAQKEQSRGMNPTSTTAGNAVLHTLFPILHAVAALQGTLRGDLSAIDALLGCPLGLFPMQHASPKTFVTLDASTQRQVLLGLFYALNWCRELVNAFSPVAGGNLSSAKSGSQKMMTQIQLSLMLRLRAASQLEATLASLLAVAPPMLTLPCLSVAGESATAAPKPAGAKKAGTGGKKGKVTFKEGSKGAGTSGAGGNSAGSAPAASGGSSGGSGTQAGGAAAAAAAALAAASEGLALPSAERVKLRGFAPASIASLNALSKVVGGNGELLYSVLPSAAYLLNDMVEKTRASLTQPRKMPFLSPFASKPATNAVPPSTLLAALCPAMPALRAHLDAAFKLSDANMADNSITSREELILKDLPAVTATSQLLATLPDCPAAKRAVSPTAAANRVFSGALECIRLMLEYHEITSAEKRGALQAILAAFGNTASAGSNPPQGSGSGASNASFDSSQWSSAQLRSAFVAMAVYFFKLVPATDVEDDDKEPTAAEMERWPAVLALLEALLKVGEQLRAEVTADATEAVAWSKKLTTMRKKLSGSAALMLQYSWPNAPSAADVGENAGDELPAGGWKGRARPLSEAIRISIVYSTDPLAVMNDYVATGLLEVSSNPTGKENSAPLDEYPSLSGVTIGVWYKSLWDVLQNQWKDVSAAAKSSGKAANAAPEAAGAIVKGIASCCAAFNNIVGVVKTHTRRAAVLNAAAKGGAVFVEGVLRVIPFWKEVFAEHKDTVLDSIKSVQKACRQLNTLSAEGKIRGDMNVVLRVSRLKKAIESFVAESYLLLRKHAPELEMMFGELKHRDLQGNALETSQMYPSTPAAEDDDEGQEDDEMGEYEEEGEV